jgi:hypothetical protein
MKKLAAGAVAGLLAACAAQKLPNLREHRARFFVAQRAAGNDWSYVTTYYINIYYPSMGLSDLF